MTLDIANLMNVIGSATPIIFAAWIFVGFLQNRYEAAIHRYRELIDKYRECDSAENRKTNMRDQIVSYRHRCELMRRAMSIGLASAISMVVTLILGGLSLSFEAVPLLGYLSAGFGLLGFLLVIVATIVVFKEGIITHRQLDNELLDVPDLAHSTGHEAGAITDLGRRRATERRSGHKAAAPSAV